MRKKRVAFQYSTNHVCGAQIFFLFKASRTVSALLTEHPSSPSSYWFCSARLPVRVLFVFLCSSNLWRFTCLSCISPKYYFLFTKSFKDSRPWHHLSFPKHWLFWALQCAHSAEVLLISPRWKHYWVMCRDLKTKSGPEVAWDYPWGEFFSSLFVPARSHWMPLKSLTENLGQHVAWGHLHFKSAAIFLHVAFMRQEHCVYSQWAGAQTLAQKNSESNFFMLCWRKYVRRVHDSKLALCLLTRGWIGNYVE